jgi:hypothetical protein
VEKRGDASGNEQDVSFVLAPTRFRLPIHT